MNSKRRLPSCERFADEVQPNNCDRTRPTPSTPYRFCTLSLGSTDDTGDTKPLQRTKRVVDNGITYYTDTDPQGNFKNVLSSKFRHQLLSCVLLDVISRYMLIKYGLVQHM